MKRIDPKIPVLSLSAVFLLACGSGSKTNDKAQVVPTYSTLCEEVNHVFEGSLDRHISATRADAPKHYRQSILGMADNYRQYFLASKYPEVESAIASFEASASQRLKTLSEVDLEASRKSCAELKTLTQTLLPLHAATKSSLDQETFIKDIYRTFLEEFARSLDVFSSYTWPRKSLAEDSTHHFGFRLKLNEEKFLLVKRNQVEVFSTSNDSIPLRPGEFVTEVFSRALDKWRTVQELSEDSSITAWDFDVATLESTKPDLRLKVKDSAGQIREVTLPAQPDLPEPPQVRAERRDDILFVEFLKFDVGSSKSFRSALVKAKHTDPTRPLKGIVLDMRYNRGGDSNEAAEIASIFVKSGPLWKDVSRHKTEIVFASSAEDDALLEFREKPLVILVNRFSVSNGEFVPFILRELGRAVIVGETTFGKSVGQFKFNFDLGSLIGGTFRITMEVGHGISGRTIHGLGLKPDIEVTDEGYLARIMACQATKDCPAMSIQEASLRERSPALGFEPIASFGDQMPSEKLSEWLSARTSWRSNPSDDLAKEVAIAVIHEKNR